MAKDKEFATKGLIRISPSSISDFLVCEFKWYAVHYRKLVKRPLSASLFWGTATDFAISEDYRNKKNTGKNLTRSNVQDIFASMIDGEYGRVEEWDTFADRTELKDWGVKGVAEFHRIICTRVDPVDVQPWLELEFEGGVKIVGKPDVVERRPIVRDTKTSSKSWSDGRADQQIQTYAYPLMLDGGSEIDRTMTYDILVKKKEPEIQQQTVIVGPKKRRAFLVFLSGLVKKMNHSIAIKSYPPTGYYSNNHLCTRKYCPAWKLCEATWGIRIKGEA